MAGDLKPVARTLWICCRSCGWDAFWAKYGAEKLLLDAFRRGELREDVTLELLNMQLHVTED